VVSVHGAQPRDVFVDRQGKLWRVVGVWTEPTVIMEEIEEQHGTRLHGGVSGMMWDGFKRIWRKEDEPAKPRTHFDEMSQTGSGV
jgi:hypothetical protein